MGRFPSGEGGMGSERMVAKYVNILSYYYTRPLSASSLPSPPPSRRAQVTVRNAITGSTVDDGRAGFSSFFFYAQKAQQLFIAPKYALVYQAVGGQWEAVGKIKPSLSTICFSPQANRANPAAG